MGYENTLTLEEAPPLPFDSEIENKQKKAGKQRKCSSVTEFHLCTSQQKIAQEG